MDLTTSIFKQEDNIYMSLLYEVNQIINLSDNFEDTLDSIVNIVSNKLKTDVCSIYLLDSKTNILTLKATKGLNLSAKDKISLKLGEGVTSLAIEKMHPISIDNVKSHPRFKNFEEAEETPFNSFLGLPIIGNKKPIGVFVVQKKNIYSFHANEINMLQILASQIAGVIQVAYVISKTINQKDNSYITDNTKLEKELEELTEDDFLVNDLNDKDSNSKTKKKISSVKGITTSFGYGYGKVLLLEEAYNLSVVTANKIDDINSELNTLDKAIEKSKEELLNIKENLQKQISSNTLQIFDSHIMLIEDTKLHKDIKELIQKGYNAAFATFKIINNHIETFKNFDDPYIKDRAIDIEDIGRRIINNILGICPIDQGKLPNDCIVVSKFLTPSTTANLDVSKVRAIVTEHGGNTSHASILARSLEIPAVVIPNILSKITLDDYVLVDGNTGFVFINPLKPLVDEYQVKAKLEVLEFQNYFNKYLEEIPKTKDGKIINISSNIGLISDIEMSKRKATRDVGLFRTEFLYMIRNSLPSKEEQKKIYDNVISSFPDGEITIRTLDIGGDKLLPYLPLPSEENPCLGYKSSRFLLDHPKILLDQIEAILMSSVNGKVRILFPMISHLNELLQLKEFLQLAKDDLKYSNIPYSQDVDVGMMIEVPSIIFQIDDFVPYVDFFSIGTNDLIQYILAVDRDNEKVSDIYSPLNPAVLRAIDIVVRKVAKHKNKRLSVCGEMAGPTESTFVLLALGITDLSASPATIPYLHYMIQQLDTKLLESVGKHILSLKTTQDVEFYVKKTLREVAPRLFTV